MVADNSFRMHLVYCLVVAGMRNVACYGFSTLALMRAGLNQFRRTHPQHMGSSLVSIPPTKCITIGTKEDYFIEPSEGYNAFNVPSHTEQHKYFKPVATTVLNAFNLLNNEGLLYPQLEMSNILINGEDIKLELKTFEMYKPESFIANIHQLGYILFEILVGYPYDFLLPFNTALYTEYDLKFNSCLNLVQQLIEYQSRHVKRPIKDMGYQFNRILSHPAL